MIYDAMDHRTRNNKVACRDKEIAQYIVILGSCGGSDMFVLVD